MKKYNNFLFELIKNEKNLKYHLRKMLIDIRNLDFDTFNFKKTFNEDDSGDYELTVDIDSVFEKQVIKIVQKCQQELLKTETYLYYTKTYDRELEFSNKDDLDLHTKKDGKIFLRLYMYMKDIHIMRVKPSEFVYHTSFKEHRESILKNGLIPSENKNFANITELNHPPMVFASLKEPLWQIKDNRRDIWEIDTKKINNKWWLDPNMIGSYRGKEMIITFDPILPTAIKLYN